MCVINISKLWIDPKLKSVFWTFWMLWCSCLQKKRSSKIWFNFEYYDFLCLLWMIFGFILSLIFGFILSLIFIAIYSIHWISDLNSDGSLYSLLTGWRWWGQSENRTSKKRKKKELRLWKRHDNLDSNWLLQFWFYSKIQTWSSRNVWSLFEVLFSWVTVIVCINT